MQIANDHVVTIHYHLTDADGQVLDSSRDGPPLTYLHGHGNLIPGLESQLLGKVAGDQFTAEVACADAYGEYDPELVVTASRAQFPGDVEIEPGMRFHASTPSGQTVAVVTAVEGDQVTVDTNHPLAGVDLTFAVEVMGVRCATDSEVAHGHVHQPKDGCDGNGGCGCHH